jgi:EAL domain-containing protein (putative c-di-GMP-specific phosphodiesterase class I)
MKVTAEGIETYEQMEHLQRLNCDQGQGYFFAKPLPPEAAEALLARNPVW